MLDDPELRREAVFARLLARTLAIALPFIR